MCVRASGPNAISIRNYPHLTPSLTTDFGGRGNEVDWGAKTKRITKNRQKPFRVHQCWSNSNSRVEWCAGLVMVVALVESVDVNWIYLLPVKKARKRKLIRAKQKYIICYAIQLRQKSNPNAPPSLRFKSHTNTHTHAQIHIYEFIYPHTNSPTHRIGTEREQLCAALYCGHVLFASFFELTSSESSKRQHQQQQQQQNSRDRSTSSSRLPLPSNQSVGSEEHVDKV